MKCYIREIAIFDKEGTRDGKRGVKLVEGLNIIAGRSQTGKSALLEIVDYCLLSSRCTIPQGKIIEYADLFAIVLELEDKYIVLGRPNPKTDDSNKIYFNIEYSESAITDIQKSYFSTISPVPRDSLKKVFGRLFEFDVPDITLNIDPFLNKKGRASFRNMVPYLFQHQNLIANKHAMFYRFDNRDIRERTIDEFPIFMGWVSGEYYVLNRELNEKKKELRQFEREEANLNKNRDNMKSRLEGHLKSYYAIIGVPYPEIKNLNQLLRLAQNLPEFNDKSFVIGDFEGRLIELKQRRNELSDNRSKIKKEIHLLETASSSADKYCLEMVKLSNRSEKHTNGNHLTCPLCNQELKSTNEKVYAVKESRKAFFVDLHKLKNYSIDNFTTIERLKKERDIVNQKILAINGEIEILNKAFEKEREHYDLKQEANELKHLIELSIELIFGKTDLTHSDKEKSKLINEIDLLKRKLGKYNLESCRQEFNHKLNKDMNKICSKLDFEEELKPPKLNFDSKSFEFYHEINSYNKVSLSEMGSGANWLACHLSLFLGLHKQFAINKNCKVPSFIFLDQPSQVYFPNDFNQDNVDIKSVANIYDVVIETIEDIKEESTFKPQIIITDHANNLKLNNGNYNNYIRKEWFDGSKLI